MFDVYNLKLSKYITDRELFGAILEWDSFSLHIKIIWNCTGKYDCKWPLTIASGGKWIACDYLDS